VSPPGNPTAYLNLIVPVVVDNQVAGLPRSLAQPGSTPECHPGFLQFMSRMAEMATRYARNQMLRQMVGQQQLWVQLEGFARDCHASLNPIEVAYRVANDGRRLIDCDRVSVGIRYGWKVRVESISAPTWSRSGPTRRPDAEAVRRGHQVGREAHLQRQEGRQSSTARRRPRRLSCREQQQAAGGAVARATSARAPTTRRCRVRRSSWSASSAAAAEQLFARLEVIGRHASTALYNAVEHRRIPMRFVWMPIAAVQEGLAARRRPSSTPSRRRGAAHSALIFVPYPLKMDATGQLLPEVRRWVYAPTKGR
jgi:hypothetical protein